MKFRIFWSCIKNCSAISDSRIKHHDLTTNTVHFTAKNYKKEGRKEILKLSAKDFIRRFQLHILPKGFTRIRHYGILSSTWKKAKLPKLQRLLNNKQSKAKTKEKKPLHLTCNACKKGKLVTLLVFGSRGPPVEYLKLIMAKS